MMVALPKAANSGHVFKANEISQHRYIPGHVPGLRLPLARSLPLTAAPRILAKRGHAEGSKSNVPKVPGFGL